MVPAPWAEAAKVRGARQFINQSTVAAPWWPSIGFHYFSQRRPAYEVKRPRSFTMTANLARTPQAQPILCRALGGGRALFLLTAKEGNSMTVQRCSETLKSQNVRGLRDLRVLRVRCHKEASGVV